MELLIPSERPEGKARLEDVKQIEMKDQDIQLQPTANFKDETEHKYMIEWGKEEVQKQMQTKLRVVEHDKIVFTKPLAIIINPNSGKKRDVQGIIE